VARVSRTSSTPVLRDYTRTLIVPSMSRYLLVIVPSQCRGALYRLDDFRQSGTGEGHRPWDLQPESAMTNGNVDQTVVGIEGQTLTLSYKGGEKM
jgi:hypothetical protein